jgi:hypothetical protein
VGVLATDETVDIAALPKDAMHLSAEAMTITSTAPFGSIDSETRSQVETAHAHFGLTARSRPCARGPAKKMALSGGSRSMAGMPGP